MTDITNDRYRLGVGMVLINSQGLVFAGKRNTNNTKMISWFLRKPWQMPQGGIEQGETPYEAVLRELNEELGTNNVELIAETQDWLEYSIPPNLRRKDSKFVGQRQKWFLLRFLGTDSDVNLKATNHCEFDSWRWMTTRNIMRVAVNFKRNLYREVFRNFKDFIDNGVLI